MRSPAMSAASSSDRAARLQRDARPVVSGRDAHLGRNRRLVDEDKARCLKLGLLSLQFGTRRSYIRTVLFSGVQSFFERDVMAFIEAPDRCRPGFQPLLGLEPRANLFECQVRLRCDQIKQPLAMRPERRATVARAGRCRYTARCRPAFDPTNCGRGAETENPRRFSSALAVLDKRDRSRPEIIRVSLRYRQTSPLLSKQPESDLRPFGNPLMFRFTSTENRSSGTRGFMKAARGLFHHRVVDRDRLGACERFRIELHKAKVLPCLADGVADRLHAVGIDVAVFFEQNGSAEHEVAAVPQIARLDKAGGGCRIRLLDEFCDAANLSGNDVAQVDIAVFGGRTLRFDAEGHDASRLGRDQPPPARGDKGIGVAHHMIGGSARTIASLSRDCANTAPADIGGPESRRIGSSSTSALSPISANCSSTMNRYAVLVMTIGRSNSVASDTRSRVS